MSYEELLKRARKDLPELSEEVARFEVPKVRGHIQGNKTIISNFHQIAQAVGRDVEHLLKYVLRELATPGDLTSSALIVGTKTPASRINEKIQQYVKDFVMCSECNRPDTKLVKEDKINFIKCSVCGAKHPVRAKL
ncbi:translation initiation factor IF-2 subunit beta [Candidatus Woesearchaeota archaeon]|nr:translation initiation factor IF-2 subunit beta [Candidatus Woesearchaeota archaeon]|tara:strand:+ start:13109 stop:13516 length:408 start_codon:yes stop_codon:yes gene_type:complete